jgi:hypothetical protein
MLGGLDAVAWAELKHAYGSAADVPDLLRKLVDPDRKVRQDTMWALYANVFHQGTRYPATPYVIPFLIELCASPVVPERGELLRYWGDLITGYFSIQERPCWGDGERVFAEGQILKEDVTDEYTQALHAIYRNSLEGRQLLFALLSDDDAAVRAGAAWVLACLPTIADESMPRLRRRVATEPSGWVRAAIAFALGEVGDEDLLDRLLALDKHDAVRCISACELARIAPSEALIDPLLGFIANPIEGYENVPGAGDSSAEDAAFSVAHLPQDVRRKAMPGLCDRLNEVRTFATMPIVTALLSTTFQPREEPLTELDDQQRLVLLRLVSTQELWLVEDLAWTFREFGLPTEREECAELAGARVVEDAALAELSVAVTFAEMGFFEDARRGIEKALALDPAVFARAPSPDECWLLCANAFAETDPVRAMHAFRTAQSINSAVIHRVGVNRKLAELLREGQAG